jgi:hypothetical protein
MFEDLVVVWFRSCCFKKIVSVSITFASIRFVFVFVFDGRFLAVVVAFVP